MEVVNDAVLRAQAELDNAKAEIGPRKNALDNVMLCRFKLLWGEISHGLFPPSSPIDKSDYLPSHPESGFHNASDGYEVDLSKGAVNGMLCLKGFEAQGAKSVEDWAKCLGVSQLVFGMTRAKAHYDDPGRWESLKEKLDAMSDNMSQRLRAASERLDEAARALEEAKASGPKALGGSLLLVDLAGADYDHRSGKVQKESAAINKSLLSLKECLRSLAKVSSSAPRAKFRDSKLTRLLEDSLAPSEHSKRSNVESASVMLVNVSPAAHLSKMTFNSLRYGQMFAAAEHPRQSSYPKPAPKQLTKCGPPRDDPKIRESIIAIYHKHCPEKNDKDIDVILRKFSGKLSELLEKAQEKYAKI
jgi:hypothetical protein